METRAFGRTGLKTSILGFGCGAVGGLLVRGAPADQERTVAEALEAGINYFDTAPLYGNGQSETNLGRILKVLKPAGVIVGTKVRLRPEDMADVRGAVTTSLDASLARLGTQRVDILHLHNTITSAGGGELISARQVLDEVVPAFEALQRAGKIGFPGVTVIGDTASLHQVIDAGGFGSAQVVYNMLNPSAGGARATATPGQDYAALLDRCRAAGTGVVGIRILAGGALSGSAERHPIAGAPPAPIGSAASYALDVEQARRLLPLVEEGYTGSLAEAAVRFAIGQPDIGTILVGIATPDQFRQALAAVRKGPLPDAALKRLAELQTARA
jgi:L-galactose dehydrogenase/L-glyceraldehyde 3-phosphate reductase